MLLPTRPKAQWLDIAPLFLVSCIWGFSFVFQSEASKHLEPLTFNAIRFTLGGLLVGGFALILPSSNSSSRCSWRDISMIKVALLAGIFLTISMGLQQTGMATSTVGNAGFITNMDVIIVPVLAIVFQKKQIGWAIWLSVLMAVIGLFLISFTNSRFATGDVLMLGVASAIALRGLTLGYSVKKFDPLKIATYMFLVVGTCSAVGALIFEQRFALESVRAALPSLLYLTVLSTAVAYTVETFTFRKVDPVRVSLIINLEAVFAAFAGWLVLDEKVSLQTGIGFVVLFCAILITIIFPQTEQDAK